MVFVDTSVLMYAVGRDHPLRPPARRFFAAATTDQQPLATSSEVLQELAHAYLPVERPQALENMEGPLRCCSSTGPGLRCGPWSATT